MPAVYRLSKQLLYGTLYLILAVILITSLTTFVHRLLAPPPPPPAVALPKPLQIEQVAAIRHGKTTDLVARLRNPNTEVGIRSVTGTFHMLADNGTEVGTHQETTYLLPATLQYLLALDVPTTSSFARVELTLSEPKTAAIPSTISLPSFATFLRERTQFKSGERSIEQQTGILRNASSLDWERIEIIGLAVDDKENIVGVSKTFLGALAAGSQLEFTLQWPTPARPTQRVIIWPTTNIFEETNIIKVIGDPASLR